VLKTELLQVKGKVLLVMDACHSGAIGNSGSEGLEQKLAAADCGVVVMCAAMGHEEAGEEAKLGHGYFTAALLKGLRGEAKPYRNNLVHLSALQLFVEDEVSRLSNDEQHAVMGRPLSVTSFPLTTPEKPK
jgi:uncharacterized caspase-like protein